MTRSVHDVVRAPREDESMLFTIDPEGDVGAVTDAVERVGGVVRDVDRFEQVEAVLPEQRVADLQSSDAVAAISAEGSLRFAGEEGN